MAAAPLPDRIAGLLDRLGLSFALCGGEGASQWLRTSAGWRRLLEDEPRRPLIEDAALRLVDRVVSGDGRDGDDPALLSERVRTRRGTYSLFGTGLETGDGSEVRVCALVALAPPDQDPLGDPVLRRRFRLTPREAELARLLVRGLTNAEIAERMGISGHTAHHYTERVLLKLDVSNRTQVGAKLLL